MSLLVAEGEKLKHTLSESRKNISDTRTECKSTFPAVLACDTIPDEQGLQNDANFNLVPNITDTKVKVQDVIETNLTQEA